MRPLIASTGLLCLHPRQLIPILVYVAPSQDLTDAIHPIIM